MNGKKGDTENAYIQVDPKETRNILLNFHEKIYINSEGLKVLIQLLAETKKNQQQIGIVRLFEHFKKMFRMVGVTKATKFFDSVNEAIEGLCGSTENSVPM